MSEIINVKGIVLNLALIWNGLELKPNTEFSFSLTEKQYNLLKDRFVKFETSFSNADREIIVDTKLENNIILEENTYEIINQEDKVIEDKILNEEENDYESLSKLISKREEIVEKEEQEKQVAFERKKMEEVRPIPKPIKRKIKK